MSRSVPANPPRLLVAGGGCSNQIIGASTLTLADYTPIAMMLQDYVVFAVASNSSIASGKEPADRRTKDPRSVAIGFANPFGGSRHIAAGLLLKALRGNPRDLKTWFSKARGSDPAVRGPHRSSRDRRRQRSRARLERPHARARWRRLSDSPACSRTCQHGESRVRTSSQGRGAGSSDRGLTPAQVASGKNAMRGSPKRRNGNRTSR